MADQKVSDLPSLNGADVDAADLLYIVDSSAGAAGSKKITIGQYQLAPVSGGTANTVVYLNGSKVESSSSALTFDGTNFATTGTSSAAKLIPTGGTATGNGMYLPAANTLAWSNNGAETMRLDSSGNLGLGVTPSAWQTTSYKVLEFPYGVSLFGQTDAASMELATNGYLNSSYQWTYKTSTYASHYRQYQGQHQWFTAPSGTAGNAISFTQAMTLTAGGNLLVGTTSDGFRANITGTSSAVGTPSNYVFVTDGRNGGSTTDGGRIYFGRGGATTLPEAAGFIGSFTASSAAALAGGLIFGTNGSDAGGSTPTERARITSGGDLLVGTTNTSPVDVTADGVKIGGTGYLLNINKVSDPAVALARSSTTGSIVDFYYRSASTTNVGNISTNGTNTAYNTTSDYRLKDNPQPLTDSGAFIDALQPKTWEWKVDGSRGVGFIAHEVQAVSPGSVVGEKDAIDADGKPVMQAMEYGSAEFIANIIAELQSLRARVAALEAK